jgi:hypothetical protein
MTTTASVREDRFGSRVPPVGSVLRWRHQGVTYLAHNVGPAIVGASWRVTADADRDDDISWDRVRSLIGNNPCTIATGWVEVPMLDSADFGDPQVVDYARQLGGRWGES